MCVCVCVCDRSTFSGVTQVILDRLADSHTMLAIYPACTIHYQRVVIRAFSIPGSRGEGSGPPWSPSDK